MTVSNSWLVNVNVSLNTTVVQAPNFNNCMLLGVMPTQSSPYQCPPTSWGVNPFQVYTSASSFNADFASIIAGAITVGDVTQINRLTWLRDAVTNFFAQATSPLTLTVMKMDPTTGSTDYTATLAALSAINNDWYGFSICDNIPVEASEAPNFSFVTVSVDITTAQTIKVGTIAIPSTATPSSPYILLMPAEVSIGTTTLSFYSKDITTVLPSNAFASIQFGGVTIPGTNITSADASSLVDLTLSKVTVSVTGTSSTNILAGSTVSSTTVTPVYPYVSLISKPINPGVNTVDFFSFDSGTVIPPGSMTSIKYGDNVISGIQYPQTNLSSNTPFLPEGAPGILTPVTGVVAALANLRSADTNSPKKLLLDTNDPTIAQAVQTGTGSKDLMICYHSLNLQAYTATIRASLSAAVISAYFVNLFAAGIGMKPISSLQLTGVPLDPTITTANIGSPGTPGSSDNLIGWNNNVYAGFGSTPGVGLMQYGFMSNSNSTVQVYLDQVVGSDFVQLTTQADLVTLIIQQQPTGGLVYDDFGIQQILSVFKASVQKAVDQNILQTPPNSAFVYKPYSQVLLQNITNRVYNDLSFSGKFLSRIQKITLNVNLSL